MLESKYFILTSQGEMSFFWVSFIFATYMSVHGIQSLGLDSPAVLTLQHQYRCTVMWEGNDPALMTI